MIVYIGCLIFISFFLGLLICGFQIKKPDAVDSFFSLVLVIMISVLAYNINQ